MPPADHETLKSDFEAFAARMGWSLAKAGRELAGDHKLARRIAEGRLTYASGAKLRRSMAEVEQSARVSTPSDA